MLSLIKNKKLATKNQPKYKKKDQFIPKIIMKPSLFLITFIILFSINCVYTKNIIYTRYVKNLQINHGGNNVFTKLIREVFNTKLRPPVYDTTNDLIDIFLKSDPASLIIEHVPATIKRSFEDSDEYNWDEHIPYTTEKIVEYNDEDYPDEEYEE